MDQVSGEMSVVDSMSCNRSRRVHSPHHSKCLIGSVKIFFDSNLLISFFTNKLTAILALLRLFGRGTWKFLPSKSVLSSSSLELEFSRVRIPFL